MANLAILICEELGSLLQDDDNQFDRRQGVQVLAFQLSFTAWFIALDFLMSAISRIHVTAFNDFANM